jgi:replication-associated recombination protein RarA
MLIAGEDPLYIARRLIRMASEDIGMGDSSALPLVMYHPRVANGKMITTHTP